MPGWLLGGSSVESSPLFPLASGQSFISSSELHPQSLSVSSVAAGTSAVDYSVGKSEPQVAGSGVATPHRCPRRGVAQAETRISRKEIRGGISRRNPRNIT